jgi:hypothetical protein
MGRTKMSNFVLKGNIEDITVDELTGILEKISVLYHNLDELALWDEFVWGSNGSPLDVDYIEADISEDLNLFVVHTDTGGSFGVEVIITEEEPIDIDYIPLSRYHNMWFRLV